jgi:hypothetical protein
MDKMIYVSAQPDLPYFHWQCEVYGFNFVENGIKPSDIHMIFGMVNPEQTPTKSALKLRDKGFNVHFYSDLRDKKEYIASIKPYLIFAWLKNNPEFGSCFFLHDSDIIFREKPDYDKYLNDEYCYLGDTKLYTSYDYLLDCSKRYSEKHNLNELELINKMIDVFGIERECLKIKNEVSGGAQYIIKKTNYKDWYKIYQDSNELFEVLENFHKTYPIQNGIQTWTAEMWSLLWNLWCMDKQTKIIKELNFSWATNNLEEYYKHPILHMAGVQYHEKDKKFYKGEFTSISPLDKLKENFSFFDYVSKESATTKYVEVMKTMIKKQKMNYL